MRKGIQLGMSALLATSFVLSGCMQTVQLTSEPEGADVYISNIYVGKTPAIWRTRSGLPDTAYVRIEKEGFEPIKTASIDKIYRADIQLLWLIPGIIPYFVGTARFEDDYIFHLKALPGQNPAPAAGAAATPRAAAPTPAEAPGPGAAGEGQR